MGDCPVWRVEKRTWDVCILQGTLGSETRGRIHERINVSSWDGRDRHARVVDDNRVRSQNSRM